MDWQAHEAMFADNVTNTGRAATTVNAVQTHFDSKPASSINAAPGRGKDLPYRLEPNHQEAWLLSAHDLTGYVLDLQPWIHSRNCRANQDDDVRQPWQRHHGRRKRKRPLG